MATPNQEAIDTFITITGASGAVAVHKLQEHQYDLNRAMNAYYSEGCQNSVPVNVPLDDAMDIDDVGPSPLVTPIEVTEPSEDVTETVPVHGPATTQGAVIVDEGSDDDIDDVSFAPTRGSRQVIAAPNNVQDYNDIEEEMIQAAIEASKAGVEGLSNPIPVERLPSHMGDDDVAKAVTVSLKSGEEEVLRSQGFNASTSAAAQGLEDTQAVNGRLASPSSPFEDHSDDDDEEEEPLVRHRPIRVASGSLTHPDADRSRSRSPEGDNQADNGNRFPSEWGGISSEEHDEAVMLEAAMFGGIPETGYNHLPFVPPQQRAPPRPPSPSLTAQRLIREQQDDEYLASLQADRDRELQSIRDAEARQLEEETARKAFLEEEKKRLEEEKELERQLGAKEASLPKEPHADEENAITLLVRMPDGTRHGRRFLKSDKLQSLFDFIDIARVVKPKTYRLVRPYPRHAFGDGESVLICTSLHCLQNKIKLRTCVNRESLRHKNKVTFSGEELKRAQGICFDDKPRSQGQASHHSENFDASYGFRRDDVKLFVSCHMSGSCSHTLISASRSFLFTVLLLIKLRRKNEDHPKEPLFLLQRQQKGKKERERTRIDASERSLRLVFV
ncbi:UBX domain-containing protein [Hirschfeldia incana]|nr:UBX domain-containing protein [Hirschfeldia incana]